MSEGGTAVANFRLLLFPGAGCGECVGIQQEGREVAKAANLQGLGPARRKVR